MGRPLEKRLLGNTAAPGPQIQVTAFVVGGSSAVTGYVAKQVGSKRFRVTTAQGTSVCTLTTGVPTEGQVRITATDSASGTYFVSKIAGRKATLVRGTGTQFAEGASVPWNLTGAVLNASVLVANA
jgi:hypothetical protein